VAARRARIRSRLEEITRADAIEANLRRDEKLYRFLGVVPPDLDLVRLYHDLLEEQLAGFYDIDRRELVLAEWLPREHQSVVLAHELTHALQDQHFSLRVRKRLGFETPDAEAAWQALVEGDATAVMAELSLAPLGKHFTILADSGEAAQLAPPAARAAAGGIDSELFLSAPTIVREGLSFPYVHGLRYVMSLYRDGGWPAVDAAFVHPPASTEQIIHAERIDNTLDAPISIEIPDVRGMLGTAYEPVSNGTLGERELYAYIAQFVDPAVAEFSAEGWGGCSYILYAAGPEDPPAFVLVSMWDSEDDAVEFFGGLIGGLEARYPNQQGDPENSTQDQVLWTRDNGRKVNVLRLRERQVVCLEGIPEPRFARVLGKLDSGTRLDDPTPEVRARQKDNLPWNRKTAPLATGALRPSVELPADWARVEPRMRAPSWKRNMASPTSSCSSIARLPTRWASTATRTQSPSGCRSAARASTCRPTCSSRARTGFSTSTCSYRPRARRKWSTTSARPTCCRGPASVGGPRTDLPILEDLLRALRSMSRPREPAYGGA
jgi:hypothetical protein